jgi:hypothetical protein
VGTTGRPDGAEPPGWEASSSEDGLVCETVAYLAGAVPLLERLGRTIASAPGRLTFVEVDDAIRCVSRALLALGTDRPRPSPVPQPRLQRTAGTGRTGGDRPAQKHQW